MRHHEALHVGRSKANSLAGEILPLSLRGYHRNDIARSGYGRPQRIGHLTDFTQ